MASAISAKYQTKHIPASQLLNLPFSRIWQWNTAVGNPSTTHFYLSNAL